MQYKAEVNPELFHYGENNFPCSAQSCSIIHLNKVEKTNKIKAV